MQIIIIKFKILLLLLLLPILISCKKTNNGIDKTYKYLEFYDNKILKTRGYYTKTIEKPIYKVNILSNKKNKIKPKIIRTVLSKVWEGKYESYYPNGQKESIKWYKNGKLDGKSTYWSKNGIFTGSVEYKNGKQDGLTIYFQDENQSNKTVEVYKNGILKKITIYDKKGKLILNRSN